YGTGFYILALFNQLESLAVELFVFVREDPGIAVEGHRLGVGRTTLAHGMEPVAGFGQESLSLFFCHGGGRNTFYYGASIRASGIEPPVREDVIEIQCRLGMRLKVGRNNKSDRGQRDGQILEILSVPYLYHGGKS